MVADISEYFEPPSKKFLATSLLSIDKIKLYVEIVFIPCISTMVNIKSSLLLEWKQKII